MINKIKSILNSYCFNKDILNHPLYCLENNNFIYGCVGTTSPKQIFDCFETPKLNNFNKKPQFFSKNGILIQKNNPIISLEGWETLNTEDEKQFLEFMYLYILNNPDKFKYMNLNTCNFTTIDKDLLFEMLFNTHLNSFEK